MKSYLGKILQPLGVTIALFGFIVAGYLGFKQLQIAMLILGIAVSFIGFGMLLGAPPQPIHKPAKKNYKTMREKHIEFANRILIWIITVSFSVINLDFTEIYTVIPLYVIVIALLAYIILITNAILSDYKELYRNKG